MDTGEAARDVAAFGPNGMELLLSLARRDKRTMLASEDHLVGATDFNRGTWSLLPLCLAERTPEERRALFFPPSIHYLKVEDKMYLRQPFWVRAGWRRPKPA